MSADAAMTTPTPEKRHHKKDKADKKSSKKRARDEHIETPAKKLRTAGDEPEALRASSSAPTAAAPETTAGAAVSSNVASSNSPIWRQTTSFYVPLSSIGQRYPLESVCAEHLSPLLLTYYAPLKGVLLSYSNVRLSDSPRGAQPTPPVLAKSVDEYAVSFVWIMADFVVLRPARGVELEGRINLVNESHMGLVVWNLFSASVDRKRLPKDWTWVDADAAAAAAADTAAEGEEEAKDDAITGEGYWADANGNKVEGVIKFRVRDFDVQPAAKDKDEKGLISIEGTLLPEDEEKALDKEELEKTKGKTNGREAGSRTPAQTQGRDLLHAHVQRQSQQDGLPPETNETETAAQPTKSKSKSKSKSKDSEDSSKPKKSKKSKDASS